MSQNVAESLDRGKRHFLPVDNAGLYRKQKISEEKAEYLPIKEINVNA